MSISAAGAKSFFFFFGAALKLSLSEHVLGAACFSIGSSVEDHCRQCLLSVKFIPTGGPVYKAPQTTAGVIAKICHIYFML